MGTIYVHFHYNNATYKLIPGHILPFLDAMEKLISTRDHRDVNDVMAHIDISGSDDKIIVAQIIIHSATDYPNGYMIIDIGSVIYQTKVANAIPVVQKPTREPHLVATVNREEEYAPASSSCAIL